MSSTIASSPKTYLLILKNTGAETLAQLTDAGRAGLLTQWNAWYDQLAKEGKAFEGQPLMEERRVVSGRGGSRVVDGPYAEATEVVGGYIKLRARDLEEATRLVQSHPMLAYGMAVEIREFKEHCHLGVVSRS